MMSTVTKADGGSEKKTLILAILTGVCAGGFISSTFTVPEIPFSIFPIISLVFCLISLYKQYIQKPVTEDLPLLGFACFLVGLFGYSAFIKAQYPGSGSNFLAIMIVLGLLAWIGKKRYLSAPKVISD